LRKKTSDGCERLIWDFFEHGGQVVIYDANNGTKASRHALAEKFDAEGIHVVLLGMALSTPYNDLSDVLILVLYRVCLR
jgi:tRNA splicing ligase